ncbi:carbamoyl-phosphate synthase large subunit [Buchnera aphidicola (Thelaxes californica)]|uniref:Carbamoyl phosphate synthase large chain n=1 Tax=Buchnera aphidicola (Thelaxes californica) TaxID=1315998 RepID=A0A4D6Y9I7_9GAMM|nr:carbamoyl-phosphate synthase large subunit [Buchnera aphidicola]QCI26666.1 carbamoyl-phosphate synthase large subunit [Buchnera aphidicola (Thelaxes californica)]
MPKRHDLKTILILGSGPIVIGQACEFDYSGVQACKALKEEGYKIILVNSNPATIMTDPDIADVTYIEPVHWKIIQKIIEKENPDAILPTMGGQTALNCVLDLHKKKVLQKFNVEILGSSINSINTAENRSYFEKAMYSINLKTAKSGLAYNIVEALNILKQVHFPCIIRPSFTMGGSGGGIAYNYEKFIQICKEGLKLSSNKELLISESLIGWKEFEMEVLRDNKNNFIVVCSIENLDPMGIHTGDSITVAPSQTLTDKEYQNMRNASKSILKKIGIKNGGANVQFAVNPINGKMIVIEMNPRVSRSSALASKATGFPIAKIAAKLSIGYTLDELKNDITNKKTPASFEPSIDYIVTKIPRFNFEKFKGCNDRLTTQMKSVGEVMAIGSTFQESLQKAICSLEINEYGLTPKVSLKNCDDNIIQKIEYELKEAGFQRLWYIADAFRHNMSIEQVHKLTKIDPWFLYEILDLILLEKKIKNTKLEEMNSQFLKKIKKKGFSDIRIAQLINSHEELIRKKRKTLNIFPIFKRIDTCAAEFQTETAYMYSTWGNECESQPTNNFNKKIIILGSGPNRIGQGIEFDYCCVHASFALQQIGYETIMINCNPETVSTDYDTSNRLYFEPITLEHILNIIYLENPKGVIIQYGGQTPLKLAKSLEKEKINILGTSSDSIDKSENRNRFQKIVTQLKLKQPKNKTVKTIQEAQLAVKLLQYPIMVRPSYVLGGSSMEILYNELQLKNYFLKILQNKNKNLTILVDQYLENAIEIDVDAVCDGRNVFIGGIMEHIEQAGIHSGDSACSLPTYTISQKIKEKIKQQVIKLSLKIGVIGLINVQFAIQNQNILILEVNPRASRTLPFIAKATGISLAKIAAKIIGGQKIKDQSKNYLKTIHTSYFSVKEAILPFNKFPGVNPILGPEMRSTGETMGIGFTFSEAFSKSMLGAQIYINKNKKVLISVQQSDKKKVINLAIKLINIGFQIDATKGTQKVLEDAGIQSQLIHQIYDSQENNIKNKKYSYIIHTYSMNSIHPEKINRILNYAMEYKIHFDTTLNAAFATVMALSFNPTENVYDLQSLHKKYITYS